MNYNNQFMTNYRANVTLEEFLNIRKNLPQLNNNQKDLLKAMNTLYKLHADFAIKIKKINNINKLNKNTKTGFCSSVYIDNKSKNIMCSGTFQKSAKKSIILTNKLIQKVSTMNDNEVINKIEILDESIENIEQKLFFINKNILNNYPGTILGGDKKLVKKKKYTKKKKIIKK